ncbi:MAG TPA: pilus assembly protein PilM [Pseudobdellovibrionaceae bacterium]|nr:pilus assembly protein PilM [Pseudobdellovibrionaceae bacterium]
MKSVGIDIGSHSIKWVELTHSSKGSSLTRAEEIVLSNSPSTASSTDQDLEIIQIIRGLVAAYDPSKTKFVMGLRQDQVALRYRHFPFNDRIKILRSLPFELEEELPFSVDTSVFEAKFIRHSPPGMDVLAIATPKHHIEKLLSLAKDCQVDLSILTYEGACIGNLLENWNEAPPSLPPSTGFEEPPVTTSNVELVLNVGHSHSLLCVFEKNSLIYSRSLWWGTRSVVQNIATKYQVPWHEALKEFREKAFILTNKQGASFDQISFSDVISGSMKDLVRDLQLAILEIKASLHTDIEHLHITGGGSLVQNLGPFLTQHLEIPVNRLSPFANLYQIEVDDTATTQSRMAIALGLAIEGLRKSRFPAVNFLKGEFAKQNLVVAKFFERWGSAMITASLVIALLYLHSILKESFTVELAATAKDSLLLQAKSITHNKKPTEASIRKFISDNKKRANEFKEAAQYIGMTSALDVLTKISESVPGKAAIGLDVVNLSVSDDNVRIEGYTNGPKENSLLTFALKSIAKDGKIQDVPPQLPNLNNRTAFAAQFAVPRGVSPATKAKK